jgi:hypothetical protein
MLTTIVNHGIGGRSVGMLVALDELVSMATCRMDVMSMVWLVLVVMSMVRPVL